MVGSPQLEALTVELLEAVHQEAPRGSSRRRATFRLARSLHGMGLLPRAIPHRPYRHDAAHAADPEWATWCERWLATSTLAIRTRRSIYYGLLKAGGWLLETYPSVRSPDLDPTARSGWPMWLRSMAWRSATRTRSPSSWHLRPRGKPISANYKVRAARGRRALLRRLRRSGAGWRAASIRIERWPPRLGPSPDLGPNPRVIADDVWAKLSGPASISTAIDLLRAAPGAYPLAD